MPTVITHALVPLLVGSAMGRRVLSPRLLAAGAVAAMLPDLDVVAFKLGIAYADALGHRGATHSLTFAVAIGALGTLLARWLGSDPARTFLWLAACTLSHPLLDALTNGGLGVALLWPWQDTRFFAPWRPIEVSPIGRGFFSVRSVAVLRSELVWVVLPAFLTAACIAVVRRGRRRRPGVS